MLFGIIVLTVLFTLLIKAIAWAETSCYDSGKLRKAMEESDKERIVRIVKAEDTFFKRLLKKTKGVKDE